MTAPTGDDGPLCICTTAERASGRHWRHCPARPTPPPDKPCGHTAAEGCNGHGDF